MIGQVIRPSYQVTGKMHPANSVKAKTLSHANTELSMRENLKACVENAHGASKLDEGSFRAYMKMYEPTGNKLVAQKCVVTELCNAYDGRI